MSQAAVSESAVSAVSGGAGALSSSASASALLFPPSSTTGPAVGGGTSRLSVSAPSSRASSVSHGSALGTEEALSPPPSSPVLRCASLYGVAHAFDPHLHWYPRALNAQLHPMVDTFMSLGNERILERFCHLNPAVRKEQLRALLGSRSRFFRWSGADLFSVTNSRGKRQMIVVETNSCPSGQKSMPIPNADAELDGYHVLLRTTFKQMLEEEAAAGRLLTSGALAVMYDKNDVEASGYAAAMVDVFHEPVYLVEFYERDADPPVCWRDSVMHVRDEAGEWVPIRAAFRYVTQKPWQRIPTRSRTLILNPIISCMAGGRNKMIADKAYEFFNNELQAAGSALAIRTPETVRDVSKSEIPLWVDSMGGHAVIKVPYSNAGQGVFTITNKEELAAFMKEDHHYDKYTHAAHRNASTAFPLSPSTCAPRLTVRCTRTVRLCAGYTRGCAQAWSSRRPELD